MYEASGRGKNVLHLQFIQPLFIVAGQLNC